MAEQQIKERLQDLVRQIRGRSQSHIEVKSNTQMESTVHEYAGRIAECEWLADKLNLILAGIP